MIAFLPIIMPSGIAPRIFANDIRFHSDISAIFNGDRVMILMPAMSGEINPIGYSYVVSDSQLNIAQVIQITPHPNKNMLSHFESAKAEKLYA